MTRASLLRDHLTRSLGVAGWVDGDSVVVTGDQSRRVCAVLMAQPRRLRGVAGLGKKKTLEKQLREQQQAFAVPFAVHLQ